MSKIRIKNFGPVKEGFTENEGWLDIKKVTVFIGNQGSGKSTVAKLISTFMWMEKALNRGDIVKPTGNDFLKLIAWQRLKTYINENSELEYQGDCFNISYVPTNEKPWPIVTKVADTSRYLVPKIMYVPAERNILSTIRGAFDLSGFHRPLGEFAEEVKRAQLQLNGLLLELPFKGFSYKYDENSDRSFVVGEGYDVDLLDSSSGLQSSIPLYLVSRYLSMKVDHENVPEAAEVSANQSVRRDREISAIMLDRTLNSEEKSRKAESVFAKYHNTCFINIVEEPELNLFPTSQKGILDSLVNFNNERAGNKLIMTTHSPYLINYLTLSVEAHGLLKKIAAAGKGEELDPKVAEIVPLNATVDPNNLAIYECDEIAGTIKLLGNYKGIPSDENKLNNELGNGNDEFAELLEIEQIV